MLAKLQGLPPGTAQSVRFLNKRTVLRIGFALLAALLTVSAWESYRTQGAEARESLEIYHRQVEQDSVLYRLRRVFWLASIHSRDFLLNPKAGGEMLYGRQLRDLQLAARPLIVDFDRLSGREEVSHRFRAHLDAFWQTLERLPKSTRHLTEIERYEFVQREIVPRRNAVGDALREFAEVKQQTMRANEAAFEANQRNASRRLFALLGLAVILGLLVAWLSLSHTERLERTTESHLHAVERAREELQLLAGRLMSVQEDERTRLSRELHDEIGQALATMRLEVVRAESACAGKLPEVIERLSRVRELAERSVRTVRHMSSELRPSVLDDLGLGPALRALAEDFSVRTGVPCRVSIPGSLPPVREVVATCVYRVVQESLHNCEKHAHADESAVTVTAGPGTLTVDVADDGCGFDGSQIGRGGKMHLGILGMTERALAASGRLAVESVPGLGTRVWLELPLEPAAGSAAAGLSFAAHGTA